MHCFYFICGCKIYVRTHVKITRQWKSALKEETIKGGGIKEPLRIVQHLSIPKS